jgi:diacylglycerol kinase (ATP)
MRSQNVRESYGHASDGLVHALRTHRHLRYDFVIITIVLLLSVMLPVSKVELLFVFSAIGLVLVAELLNTAIEVAVDLATETYHPMAKVAKDVAAAGVMIATLYAVIVGLLVFLDLPRLKYVLSAGYMWPKPHLLHLILVSIALVGIWVILGKLTTDRGTLARGGAVSGHSALAFLGFGIIYFLSRNPMVAILALLLAILVAQSRVQAEIHSVREVVIGAIVAMLVVVVLFMLGGPLIGAIR